MENSENIEKLDNNTEEKVENEETRTEEVNGDDLKKDPVFMALVNRSVTMKALEDDILQFIYTLHTRITELETIINTEGETHGKHGTI